MRQKRTVMLQRIRSREGDTLYFTSESIPSPGRSRVGFIDRDRVPEFEGTYGWFEVERVPAAPWPYWRAIRQVAPPLDWTPPEPVTLTPSQRLGHR